MGNLSNFKIAVLAIFSLAIVFGIAIFAMSRGGGVQEANLLVWGTISPDVFNTALTNSSLVKNEKIKLTYVKKDSTIFDQDFVEALAEGAGPDLVLLRDDYIFKNAGKLLVIPYKSYPERDFKDSFVEGSEIFMNRSGVVAVPFLVDPLVLYWNRDIFSNNNISEPIKYWDDIDPLIAKTTRKDSNANVLQSAIALGEWRNITNAKDIISLLFIQAGTPITTRDSSDRVISVLSEKFNYPTTPGLSALDFYTQFSNPIVPRYTWNRSLPTSLNFFLSGNLAVYIGFASEAISIQQKNPNLNFDVTYIPQIRNSPKKINLGHFYGIALVKQSKQIPAAFLAMNALTEINVARSLVQATNLPPVRRDLLSTTPNNPFMVVFYNSALISYSWIDSNNISSSNIFRDMIESVTSGRARVSEALSNADSELESQLNK